MATDDVIINLIIDFAFLGSGFYILIKLAILIKNGFFLKAKVVKVHEVMDDGLMFKPEFELLNDGRNWKAEWLSGNRVISDFGANPATHSVGDITDVFYDVRKNRIVSIKELYWGLAFGVIFSSIGVYGIFIGS